MLLYIVVAVTAAADNHVGTRIALCGFMLGPMWLGVTAGAVVVRARVCVGVCVGVCVCVLYVMYVCMQVPK